MKWNKGDIAICIDSKSVDASSYNRPPIREGSEYPVHAVNTCSCGLVSLDIGIYTDNGTVCDCGEEEDTDIWWLDSKRFIKKKHKEDSLINQILNHEEIHGQNAAALQ